MKTVIIIVLLIVALYLIKSQELFYPFVIPDQRVYPTYFESNVFQSYGLPPDYSNY